MKFLTINGKLQKDANGKLIVLPDNYEDNKIVSLSGNILTSGGKVVVTGKTIDPNAPGLYDENDNLIKTWDQLVAEGLVTVA